MVRVAKKHTLPDGRELTLQEIADAEGVSTGAIYARIANGVPLIKTQIETPPERHPDVKIIEPDRPVKFNPLTKQLLVEAEWWEGMSDSCAVKKDHYGALKAGLYAEAYRHAIRIIGGL